MNWQFWIDVGGTFTDCIARRPDGSLARHKVLSSGVTRGQIGAGSTAGTIVDLLRTSDPTDFWQGYRLRILGAEGHVVGEATVNRFAAATGTLQLDRPLTEHVQVGRTYELASDEEAPLVAIRWLLETPLGASIAPSSIRLGTTRGTNALLERRGARTAFVTTRGFGDILRIGYQNRPKLFELNIRKPQPLYEATVEIEERIAAEGTVLIAPDRAAISAQLSKLKAAGIESLAICLLHAYNHPAHERLVAEVARGLGLANVSVSHEVAPLEKIVPRGDTTVVDAYLNPVLERYVNSLAQKLPGSDVRLLTSAGGLVAAEHFSGKDSILSGPAGGVVGFSKVAEACGFARAIGFDMGGTSTDVARYDGRYEREFETEKAGVRIVSPMMAIETVAAGGGSICRFDGVKLVVGPESAGANPGPACYGRGGPLTITDMNLVVGRLVAEHFPFPLHRGPVDERLQALASEILAATGKRHSPIELAEGFLRIANANMATAVRSISVARGYDPRDYVLVAFGGAAAQHACAVARDLGMQRVLVHPDAGLLSAYGAGLADIERHRVTAIYGPLTADMLQELTRVFEGMVSDATREIAAEGIDASRISATRSLDLRYQGTDACLSIVAPADDDYTTAFEAEHQRRYGYRQTGRPIEIVAARVLVRGISAEALPRSFRMSATSTTPTPRQTEAIFQGRSLETGLFEQGQLAAGALVVGPALICGPTSTVVVEPGWQAERLSGGELLITPIKMVDATQDATAKDARAPTVPDLVQLELFNNYFTAIATQMGITLRNTACSVNVKERLDFSCAIFTADGELVVNAPHVPVHLGAMGETVRQILADNADMQAGDVFVTNDPYRGGSHLPDVTVVTPVFDPSTGTRLFFTASRAHHAEIGGITPGSMPAFSRTLAEEGVLIRNFRLLRGGVPHFAELREVLLSAPYPTRDANSNLADLAAQVAANQQGASDLLALANRVTWPVLAAYMQFIRQAAEQKTRAALARLPQGEHRFVDYLDDGSPIAVRILIQDGLATFDFAGTGPVLATNLNANRAIVTAAVMYVLRVILAEDIPLNEGVLAPITILLPECLLNPPAHLRAEDCAAVVGGNVETSQRVVDVLLGALRLAAASQGTMNNLLFGDETFGYYETICGGAGATPVAAGADAVHTHMTNTRITDPEVLERRYPVRLWRFAIRTGSGGDGQFRGGDGVVREIEFLRALTLTLLTQRRGPYAPVGLGEGRPGALGINSLRRANGPTERLGGAVHTPVLTGDRLTVKTPGGGGCTPFNYGIDRS